jgi:glycine/D-amino acid oxidase-like deaminating enzyme
VLVIEAEHLAARASGGAGGALAAALQPITAPAALVDLAHAGLALYKDLDRDWGGALGLRWLPSLLLGEHAAASPPRPAPGTELLTAEQVAEHEPDLAPVPAALLAPDQAHVHPLRLAVALARRAGSVATRIPMIGLTVSRGRVVRVHTTDGDLHPGAVVLATGMAPAPWVRRG